MLDLDELKAKLAAKIAEKLDDQVPDGTVQKIAGYALEQAADIIKGAAVALQTTENEDGDK